MLMTQPSINWMRHKGAAANCSTIPSKIVDIRNRKRPAHTRHTPSASRCCASDQLSQWSSFTCDALLPVPLIVYIAMVTESMVAEGMRMYASKSTCSLPALTILHHQRHHHYHKQILERVWRGSSLLQPRHSRKERRIKRAQRL